MLLVEDEDGVRELVRVMLVRAGYAVTPTADAGEALRLFHADPARFDLVLTDILMPGRTGVELAADIRALVPNVPILFMSGFTGGDPTRPVRLPPEAVVLEKPFDLDRLLAAVAGALRE